MPLSLESNIHNSSCHALSHMKYPNTSCVLTHQSYKHTYHTYPSPAKVFVLKHLEYPSLQVLPSDRNMCSDSHLLPTYLAYRISMLRFSFSLNCTHYFLFNSLADSTYLSNNYLLRFLHSLSSHQLRPLIWIHHLYLNCSLLLHPIHYF